MKTQKALKKRLLILSAAAKVFAEKGYSEATLADIAAVAGTYAGSLYYYFSSKEGIVEEVLNIGTTSVSSLVISKVSTLPDNISFIEKLTLALETHLEQMLLKDEFVVAYWKIIDQVPEEVRQRHVVMPKAYGQFWQRLIQEGQVAGEIRADLDAKLIMLLLIGSTIYALDWFRPDGRSSSKQIADVLAEIFFHGIVRGQREPKLVSVPRNSEDAGLAGGARKSAKGAARRR